MILSHTLLKFKKKNEQKNDIIIESREPLILSYVKKVKPSFLVSKIFNEFCKEKISILYT